MRIWEGSFVLCCCFVAGVALLGCGDSGNTPTPGAAAPPDHAAARAEFEQARRKAEREQQRQAELKQRRRGFVQANFSEIDADGRIVVSVTNLTEKAIDDIRGGFWAEDGEGNYLASSGYTEASPGIVFLAPGETKNHRPFISKRPELIEMLRDAPDNVSFVFEAMELTYADGTAEPDLDG